MKKLAAFVLFASMVIGTLYACGGGGGGDSTPAPGGGKTGASVRVSSTASLGN